MTWYRGLESVVEERVPLADRTWYHVGGSARYFCTPTSVDQVSEIVRRARARQLPLHVLGGGANVLVRDEGVEGVVLQLSADVFGQVQFHEGGVNAGAAADLPDLVRRCVRQGLAGLECLAGIPGTVGGAVRMNAGGRFGDMAQAVQSVRFVDPGGEVQDVGADALQFTYRGSSLADTVILEATLRLHPDDPLQLNRRYQQIWDTKKKSQPFNRNSAGCVFKNPPGQHAGALIDRAGLKGERCGGAAVSEGHANFIVTEPQSSARDVLTLVERIRRRVHEQFHVDLELEVEVW